MSGVTGQEEEKNPADSSESINLKVTGQDGSEVFFRIKRKTPIKKVMNAYCERRSLDLLSIKFLFDGKFIKGEQTPDELELEDGDEIAAVFDQYGGANYF